MQESRWKFSFSLPFLLFLPLRSLQLFVLFNPAGVKLAASPGPPKLAYLHSLAGPFPVVGILYVRPPLIPA